MPLDNRLRNSIVAATWMVGVLWWVFVTGRLLDLDLARFGVLPQNPRGLIGVLLAPLIHASWEHLLANTLPMLILGSALFYGYPRSRTPTLLLIWILSGLGVWLWGRPNLHFGASGIAHGLLFFLFISGVIRRDNLSIVLCFVAFSMYGGMLMTIFPTEPEISFESHFFGAAAGTLCAALFHRWDPKIKPRTYSWEQTPEQEDPLIGDLWMTERQRARHEREQAEREAEIAAAQEAEFIEVDDDRRRSLPRSHTGDNTGNIY